MKTTRAPSDYLLPDEPRPTGLAQFAVRPSFALLAAMLAGQWLALPWFVLNAFALGSPTKKRECAYVAISFAGTLIFGASLLFLDDVYDFPRWVIRLAFLAITTWKLAWAYAINTVQARTFEIYRYYGGKQRNALPIVMLAAFVLRPIVINLFDSTLWLIVVAGGLT